MDPIEQFIHTTPKNQYTVSVIGGDILEVEVSEKFGLVKWKGTFDPENIHEITSKTGNFLNYHEFVEVFKKALSQKDISSYVDILSSEDLENLKNKKSQSTSKTTSKSNKRYIILTYMTKDTKFHYPLSLTPHNIEHSSEKLKEIYQQLRVQLEAARTSALNQTQKTQNSNQSFSINYDGKSKGPSKNNQSKIKEVDQHKSENQMLKAKLARLEEQVQKKKGNIEIEAAIERTKQLKENIETANLQLVDWKNKIQDQEDTQNDLKKELLRLHKKICGLLVSEKEIMAKKKGEQTQKELNQVRNHTKKNTTEIQKLKKELQSNKAKVKELQIKAKKLNSEKEAIRKGRRGPYSSSGSVRSYNSYSSGKRSVGSYSNSSKARSNYSYNSYKYR